MECSLFTTKEIADRQVVGNVGAFADNQGMIKGVVQAIRESRTFPGEYIIDLKDSEIRKNGEWDASDLPPK